MDPILIRRNGFLRLPMALRASQENTLTYAHESKKGVSQLWKAWPADLIAIRGKQAVQAKLVDCKFVFLADQVFTGESFAVFPVYVFFPCSPMYVGKTGLAIGWACLPPRQGWGRSFRRN